MQGRESWVRISPGDLHDNLFPDSDNVGNDTLAVVVEFPVVTGVVSLMPGPSTIYRMGMMMTAITARHPMRFLFLDSMALIYGKYKRKAIFCFSRQI